MLGQVARRAADHYSELFGHGGGSLKAEIGGSIQRNSFGAVENIVAGVGFENWHGRGVLENARRMRVPLWNLAGEFLVAACRWPVR